MTFLSLILIGTLVGIFVISMGGGGGAIYLGILTGVFQLPASVAASTSLITAIPSLLLGVYVYYRQGKIDFKIGNKMLIIALPAVVVGSLIAPHIPKFWYTAIISIILIVLGIQILFKNNKRRQKISDNNNSKIAFYGSLSGVMVGIAGLSGGGPIVAGLLLMGLNMVTAAATSSYVLIGTSILGALLHVSNSPVAWTEGIGLMLGALLGAFLGPHLMQRFNKYTIWLPYVMGVLLIIMGLKTLL
ncbi:sulfite exporter TauE/SafE family protein [Leuconostoc rapi]|uniref:sulfite exporter TauE/SafE family protein n=1 Tax=Leuconostoc rapi TaxID=1406906 RepID=UPI00195BE63A|nr:sulfite exporter TauE/SafE family protein [Leuconostoc rapi]MBM7436191.1 putative membrane protein YfcA [Leuconostoc rapi]